MKKKRKSKRREARALAREFRRRLATLESVELLTNHCTCALLKEIGYVGTPCLYSNWYNVASVRVQCNRRGSHKGNHVYCSHAPDGALLNEITIEEDDPPF